MTAESFGIQIWNQSCCTQVVDEYLRCRKFGVCVNDKYSTDKNINFSVPQGSINGPVLFNSYSSTIFEVIDTKIAVNVFADDHHL